MSKILVRIETSEMKKALAMAGTVINSKNSLPILGDIVLRYNKEQNLFTLLSGNSEQFLSIDCATTDKDGNRQPWMIMIDPDRRDPFTQVAISHSTLREAIATLPAMPVTATIDTEKNLLKVNYQKGEFSLPVESADEYPALPAVAVPAENAAEGSVSDGSVAGAAASGATPLVRLTMQGDELVQHIIRASICVASDELRPQMGCVCADLFHDKAVFVSSDGHSLYRRHIEPGVGYLDYGKFAADQSATVLIVPQVLTPLKNAFAGAKSVTMTADTQRIEFATDGIRLVSRTIDSRYPNYNSVIPQNNPHLLVIGRAELSSALRRVQVFANESSNMVVFYRDGSQLHLSASDYDFSRQADEQVAIVNDGDTTFPENLRFGCKISTMLTLLSAITTDDVRLRLADPSRAFLLSPDDDKAGLLLLQMPMLVKE